MAHPELEAAVPEPTNRRLTNVLLCAYLLIQVWLPLSYYLGRDDPRDDRFAWRMFTDDGAKTCKVYATRDGRPVDIDELLEGNWALLFRLRAGARRAPLEALERYLCAGSETGNASLRLVCKEHSRDLTVVRDGEPLTCEPKP